MKYINTQYMNISTFETKWGDCTYHLGRRTEKKETEDVERRKETEHVETKKEKQCVETRENY
jgi:hypothetical protein